MSFKKICTVRSIPKDTIGRESMGRLGGVRFSPAKIAEVQNSDSIHSREAPGKQVLTPCWGGVWNGVTCVEGLLVHLHLPVIQQAQACEFALKIHLYKYKTADAQRYATSMYRQRTAARDWLRKA